MASILQYMRTDSPATVPPSDNNDAHALVFRCHDPTPAALQRIGEAADQLQSCRVAVWVSLDTTHIPEEPPSLLPILQHSPPRKKRRSEHRTPAQKVRRALATHIARGAIQIHEYDENDMIRTYPVLRDLKRNPRLQESVEFSRGTHSLAWGLHAEALNVWYQNLERKPSFVWCFEDDVGFSGSLETLLDIVRRDCGDADLITADVKLRPSEAWWWLEVHSTAFAERYGNDVHNIYVSREHVQRFSMRFLDRLHVLSLQRVTCWSEALVPTIAHAENFGVAELPRLGTPFAHDGRVTAQEWEHITASRAGRRADRLYHALKF